MGTAPEYDGFTATATRRQWFEDQWQILLPKGTERPMSRDKVYWTEQSFSQAGKGRPL